MDATAIPDLMRTIALVEPGSVDHLRELTLPVPRPGPDEVLVRVHTVAANRRDLFTIQGGPHYAPPRLPHILGIDPAGVVVMTGPGVREPVTGTRVVVKPAIACGKCRRCTSGEDDACEEKDTVGVTRPGGFAEYLTVPAANVFPLPDRLGFAEASALVHSYPVALHMLEQAGVAPGDVVLVAAAGGAVGSGAVQLAKHLGARVVAAAHGSHKTALARGLGADLVIDYSNTADFADVVRSRFPDGASVYVDSAGEPAVWSEALRALAPHARVVVCGSHGGSSVQLNLNWLFRLRISIRGCSGSTSAQVRRILSLAGAGLVRPPVDSIRPIGEAKSAFERVRARENLGKVVLETVFI